MGHSEIKYFARGHSAANLSLHPDWLYLQTYLPHYTGSCYYYPASNTLMASLYTGTAFPTPCQASGVPWLPPAYPSLLLSCCFPFLQPPGLFCFCFPTSFPVIRHYTFLNTLLPGSFSFFRAHLSVLRELCSPCCFITSLPGMFYLRHIFIFLFSL